ncbi:MAG: D-alanyl-D-alanine carboxypeptidase [Holosporaceae bacterium]|jgi:D-alanyl-D-alanine carboxypeptidase (penicillin-binding protein 5/6)|nr:D-alanyl-D-alanine carboxypeptidase [Holosporaceae bacterium]
MRKIAIFFTIVVFNAIEAGKSQQKPESNEFLSAEQAISIDFETEDCLFEKNGHLRCAPSSMTKLMTLYIVFSAVGSGRIKLCDEFPVSEQAQKMTGSRSFFQAGTMAKVEDLIKSIAVHSGNDACIVIAEGLAGDVAAFVEEMNEKAKEFGLQNTHFTNPAGLPNDDHFSSVHDIAIISKRLISDFPQFYHYLSEKVFTVNSITQHNRNTLLGNSLNVDGLKTGKTDAGGYGISISAKNDGKRLVVVVNGCKTAKARAADASKLLALGFKEFIPMKIAEAGQTISEVSILFGVKEKVGICAHENITVSVPKKYKDSLSVEIKVNEPVEAPIVLGAKLGELTYKYGNFTFKSYDLFACESVEKVNIFQRGIIMLKRLFLGNKNGEHVEKPVGIKNAI